MSYKTKETSLKIISLLTMLAILGKTKRTLKGISLTVLRVTGPHSKQNKMAK